MINEDKSIKSDFVAYLNIKNNKKVNEELINPLVDNFFKCRNIVDYQEIIKNNIISYNDFNYKNFDNFFSYFYENITNDIIKDENGIKIKVKYCITLDKQNCSKKCDNTETFYDEILLYNQPCFYFIYINIDDIFSFLRKINIS